MRVRFKENGDPDTLHDSIGLGPHSRSIPTLSISTFLSLPLEVFHRTDGSLVAETPATDGTHVVSYFLSFGLICYQMDGGELWRHPMLVAKSGGSLGTGTSPIIAGGTIILQRDVQQGSALLIALEVATGRFRRKSGR